MSLDLYIDISTHDLSLENGDLKLVDGFDELKQRAIIRSLTHKTEWLFDTDLGINWRDEIMGKDMDFDLIRSRFVMEYTSMQDVNAVTYFDIQVDTETRIATIEVVLDTVYGSIPLTITV